jgi:hypothetical protein
MNVQNELPDQSNTFHFGFLAVGTTLTASNIQQDDQISKPNYAK